MSRSDKMVDGLRQVADMVASKGVQMAGGGTGIIQLLRLAADTIAELEAELATLKRSGKISVSRPER